MYIAPINVGVVPHVPHRAAPAHRGVHPVSLRIPALGVVAPIVPESVDASGALGVPADPQTVGWWTDGARPGATRGTAIIDGHINWGGVDGALAHVTMLRVGDAILVLGVKRELRFTITALRTYAKGVLPYREIFSQRVPGRIALVTCGGNYDPTTGHYDDNIVVFAVRSKRTGE